MVNNKFEKYFVGPISAATIAIVGWSLINIIELKEDTAILKTDIKHLVKAVDKNTQALTRLSDQIAYSSPTYHDDSFDIADTLALNKDVSPATLENRDWGSNESTEWKSTKSL